MVDGSTEGSKRAAGMRPPPRLRRTTIHRECTSPNPKLGSPAQGEDVALAQDSPRAEALPVDESAVHCAIIGQLQLPAVHFQKRMPAGQNERIAAVPRELFSHAQRVASGTAHADNTGVGAGKQRCQAVLRPLPGIQHPRDSVFEVSLVALQLRAGRPRAGAVGNLLLLLGSGIRARLALGTTPVG